MIIREWNIETAVEVAKLVEHVLIANDLKAHVALGGSVLIKGSSLNDLDLFIYNHGINLDAKFLLNKKEIIQILNHNLDWNLKDARFAGNGMYEGEKFGPFVYSTKDKQGREIDIFFLNKDYTDI